MARTRRQGVVNRSSVVLSPIESNKRAAGGLLVVGKGQVQDETPDVLEPSVSPVPKTLSTRRGPLRLLAEKFHSPGPSATSVTLRKRPFCKRKWKKQFQELKMGDLRQSIWKFDKDEVRKRRRQSKHQNFSVWEIQEGNGVGLLPGFATRDYIAALAGQFNAHIGVDGRQRGKDVNKFPVLPPITDASSPVSGHQSGTKFLRQDKDNLVSEGNTPSPMFIDAVVQPGLIAPVSSPAFGLSIAGKNKTLQPIMRSSTSESPSSGHLLFEPWQVTDHSSFDKRRLPSISELVKNSRSVSPSRPPSQRKHLCSTPVFDFNSRVQLSPTICSGYSSLQATQIAGSTSRVEFIPLLPSVGGRSLKAMKATPQDSSKLSCNQEHFPMELQAKSLTQLPKSLGGGSLLPQLQKLKNIDHGSGKGNRKVASRSHEVSPFSGVMAPDNSMILENVSEYRDMDPLPPSVSFIQNQGIQRGLAPIHQKLFRYVPMSRDDRCRLTDGGVLKLIEDEDRRLIVEDVDSGQQGSSDYGSDTGRVDSPKYPTLAMVTFEVGNSGDLSLTPTAKQPMSMTVKSKRAVRKLVQEAITVSRQQQRTDLSQQKKHTEQGKHEDRDLPDVVAPRAVIAVSRRQQRSERHQVGNIHQQTDEPVDSTQSHHEDDSSNKFGGFSSDVFHVPKNVIDASKDLGKYLDEAGFPPGSAVFVPPNGEPLVLTPDGGVVALPTKLALSGNELAVDDVSAQASSRDESNERDVYEGELMNTFEDRRGATSGNLYQHSTCSDSGVYENSQHILHNAGSALAPIPSSPRSSARTGNFQHRTKNTSQDILKSDHQLTEHISKSTIETDTARGSCVSSGTRRNFVSLIAEVSAQGVQDAVDQLKQNSREGSIERSEDDHIVTEEEKIKQWQAEFREKAMQQIEEEWQKYKQQKLQQEHQAQLEQEEKERIEQAARNQDDKTSRSAKELSSADAHRGDVARYSMDQPGKPKVVTSTRVADSDEENTSEIGDRAKSSASSISSDRALGVTENGMRSPFLLDAIGDDVWDNERQQPTPEQVTLLAPKEPKKSKKKNYSIKRQVVSPTKSKQKAKPVKGKRKSHAKSRHGKRGEVDENDNDSDQMIEAAQGSPYAATKAPMQSAVSQFTTQERKRRIGVPSIDKTGRTNAEETSSSDEGDCRFQNVEKIDNGRRSFHETGAVAPSVPLLGLPHDDHYIAAEDSEALDELSFLPSDVGTSAILTDGYDSETSVAERRRSRMEKRNQAAERRRQEVERKRQEQKEARRRAAEEEARLEEMKRLVEDQLERQIAEKRKKLQEEREAREQAQREARERHEAELRQKDMMQRQMEAMKKKLQEELARRRQKEEAILEAKRLAAEAEAERQRKLEERRLNWERRILEEQDYQKRREMEEQRRREEEEARLMEEEERRRSAEEKERLQRQEEENARTVAQRKWYSKTMLEALQLMHELRLNQEFTYSYFTFLPYNSLW